MAKTLRHILTGEVRTVPDAEAEKMSTNGWAFTSKYELKRQAAIKAASKGDQHA